MENLEITAETQFFSWIKFTQDGKTIESGLEMKGGQWLLTQPPAGKSPNIGQARIGWPEALKRALVLLST